VHIVFSLIVNDNPLKYQTLGDIDRIQFKNKLESALIKITEKEQSKLSETRITETKRLEREEELVEWNQLLREIETSRHTGLS